MASVLLRLHLSTKNWSMLAKKSCLRSRLPPTKSKSKNDLQKFFIKDDDVSDNFYSLEKSMYQVISEEMLSMFASAIEFNNLMGQAVDRYRHRYKHLDKMRQLFFQKIESDMDFDRFTEYYKWIDSAISEMMVQLYPASVRHSDSIANMVESHILERNKYQNKFPLTKATRFNRRFSTGCC